ncbi:MAG: FeoA family protein [Candidatus Altiarchaeota archaeon]|nr:FeoA family protein [Candidatus Altiarchaeota archaeon]
MALRLTDLKKKEKARITGFVGGQGFRRNLETMGVRAGKVIEVIALQPVGGPVVVRIDNLTITVGRGMAQKIMVGRV